MRRFPVAALIALAFALPSLPARADRATAEKALTEGVESDKRRAFKEAVKCYTRAIEADPGWTLAFHLRAMAERFSTGLQNDSLNDFNYVIAAELATKNPEPGMLEEALQQARLEAVPGDVEHVTWPKGYEVVWNSAQKKGYSGTALLTRRRPIAVTKGIGSPGHDAEGRAITAEFDDCYVIGVYVPNAQPELARIGFRQEWDRALLAYAKKLEQKKPGPPLR